MAEVVAQQSTELSCVVIPLSGMQLLLPNICIAEILPWRRVKALEDAPTGVRVYLDGEASRYRSFVLSGLVPHSMKIARSDGA